MLWTAWTGAGAMTALLYLLSLLSRAVTRLAHARMRSPGLHAARARGSTYRTIAPYLLKHSLPATHRPLTNCSADYAPAQAELRRRMVTSFFAQNNLGRQPPSMHVEGRTWTCHGQGLQRPWERASPHTPHLRSPAPHPTTRHSSYRPSDSSCPRPFFARLWDCGALPRTRRVLASTAYRRAGGFVGAHLRRAKDLSL